MNSNSFILCCKWHGIVKLQVVQNLFHSSWTALQGGPGPRAGGQLFVPIQGCCNLHPTFRDTARWIPARHETVGAAPWFDAATSQLCSNRAGSLPQGFWPLLFLKGRAGGARLAAAEQRAQSGRVCLCHVLGTQLRLDLIKTYKQFLYWACVRHFFTFP